MSIAISIEGVSKSYRMLSIPKRATIKDVVVRRLRHEGRTAIVDALRDVTFQLSQGEALAVIGRNGSGKSTLIRVLAGVTRPDRGRVLVRGSTSAMLALGVGFHPDLTGRENARIGLLALGLSRKNVRRYMNDVIEFSELGEFIDAPVHTYSTGMYMRLAFSVSIPVRPDVLLLDEVLAVGDPAFAQKCLSFVKSLCAGGATLVLATQDFQLAQDWCSTAVWLQDGRVAAYGPTKSVLAAYEASMSSGDLFAQPLQA